MSMVRRGIKARILMLLHRFWSQHGVVVTAVLVLIAAVLGFYLRMQPYLNLYRIGFASTYPFAKLDELDPYINYWLVDYLERHGPGAWFALTRNNPATCIFWYPNCRDIASTELPGHIYTIYILYQLVKPLGVKLMDFMAVFPPLLASLAIIGIALLVHELTNSKIGAVAASWLFVPMFLSRLSAGFVVKYSFGLAVAPFVIWLHIVAIRRMRLRYFIIAGLVAAYSLLVWAGSALSVLVLILTAIMLPLFRDLKTEGKEWLLYIGIEFAIPLIVIAATPYYNKHLTKAFPVLALGASYAMLLIGWVLHRLLDQKLVKKIYTIVLVGAIVAGILAIFVFGIIKPSGKVAMALGLRPGGLPETVAEYQSMLRSGLTPDVVLTLALAVLIAAPLAIIEAVTKRDINGVLLFVWSLLSIYATLNIAYFHEYVKLVLVVLVGWIVGYLLKRAEPHIESLGRLIRVRFSLWQTLAVLLIVTVLAFSFYVPLGATREYRAYLYGLPMIVRAEGFPTPTTAWIDVLQYIRTQTPKDSLVISWWDYGYWLSVLGQRATVADGSTLNGTQIGILAKFFTSPIDKGLKYLRDFGICKRSAVYIVVFSPIIVFEQHGVLYFAAPVYPMGFGDMPKFVNAIVYIATGKTYEEYPYTSDVIGTQYGQPLQILFNDWVIRSAAPNLVFVSLNWFSDTARNATMPRLFMWGAFKILNRLYPGIEKRLVPTLTAIDYSRGSPAVVFLAPGVWESRYVFTENDFNQNYYELVYGGFAAHRIANNLVEYVLVLLFKLKDDIKQELCTSTR